MRMSRRGRKRLNHLRRDERDSLQTFCRMSRRRRIRFANRKARLRPFFGMNQPGGCLGRTTAAVSLGALTVLPAGAAEAAAINTMNDIPAAFQSMQDARDRIRDFHTAQRNVREASAALQQAKEDLQLAQQNQHQAEQGITEARDNLSRAQTSFQRISEELQLARQESARRTQEAIAAQQAVADFLPAVWDQETVVGELTADRDAVQQEYHQAEQEVRQSIQAREDGLEQRIEEAWQSVDYAQNRLSDVINMVNAAGQDTAGQDDRSDEMAAISSRLDELDRSVDEQQERLDELNGQLEALEQARDDAEEAEREARELAAERQAEQKEAGQDIRDGEQALQEAMRWKAEADESLIQAEQSLQDTFSWKKEADHALEHFGEGESFSAGAEYYNLHGAGVRAHQLYLPLNYYRTEKKYELSLGSGFLFSANGQPGGSVTGWTDTSIGGRIKKDHPVNSVHYTLDFNIPTGQYRVSSHAAMPDDVMRFTNFGEGWGITPGLEVTRHFTERDTLTGRVSLAWHGSYTYLADIVDEGGHARPAYRQRLAEYKQGRQWKQELEYLHAGEKEQLRVVLNCTEAAATRQQTFRLQAGQVEKQDDFYRDGNDWNLSAWYSRQVTAKDSWQSYILGNYAAGTSFRGPAAVNGDDVRRFYAGTGFRHVYDSRQTVFAYLNGMTRRGQTFSPWYQNPSRSRNRMSLLMGYERKVSETEQLSARLERYVIHDQGREKFHGWNMSLMYSKSF
ncbi:hypothetical protein FYJ78_02155 [Selenomonas sp. WCA-380-WT-3B 3/]|uniref:Uncharacterized protein n=1 Tax=Selenomonas montiformis TaxID=2652285 RepID=A0A6I2UXJ7_9FIRM|nr:transporter [Selenomonas montiformis]MSV24006.1 hypothetical protein [Selenomonas montiformis]